MAPPREDDRPWWKKLAWLAAIWLASVLALGVVAWLFRIVMSAAGLTA